MPQAIDALGAASGPRTMNRHPSRTTGPARTTPPATQSPTGRRSLQPPGRQQPPGSPRHLTLAAAASALLALASYVSTLNPTVSHGDSGEMIAVAHTLGVAHPPGFPLYTLMAKLASLLPLGSIAWRINLFSSLCGAAAAFFLCRAVGRWTGSVFPGILAAGVFAFSPLVWPYAVTAEVFSLNNLFVALLLDLTTSALLGREPASAARWPLVAVFVFFLGLSNHHILVLVATPAMLLVLARHMRSGGGVSVPRLAAAAVLGLLPYVWLFIAPHLGSEIVWGDSASPAGFVAHVLRSEYGTFRLATGPPTTLADVVPRLRAFLHAFGATTLWTGPLLCLAALPSLVRASPLSALSRAWAVGLAANVLVFAALSNLGMGDPLHAAVQQRFWQQGLVLLAAFMGLGLARLARLPRAGAALAALAGLALPLALLLTHVRAMDQRGHVFFRAYGEAVLASLPANAILVVTSDEAIGSVRYLQQVEGVRRDVRVLPAGQIASPWFRSLAARRMPDLRLPPDTGPGGFSFRAFLDLNLGRRRVFLVNRIPWEETLEEAYALWPTGLADEVLPRGTAPALDAWVEDAQRSFAGFDPLRRGRHDGAWERYVEAAYWKQVERFGLSLTRVAARAGGDPRIARLVTRALGPLIERHPSPPPVLLRNLGVAYQFLSREEPAARLAMARWWERYLARTPSSDPDRALIETALAQARAAR